MVDVELPAIRQAARALRSIEEERDPREGDDQQQHGEHDQRKGLRPGEDIPERDAGVVERTFHDIDRDAERRRQKADSYSAATAASFCVAAIIIGKQMIFEGQFCPSQDS